MGFMERQITVKRKWYEIDTNAGTFFIDVEDVDGGKLAKDIEDGLEIDIDTFEDSETFLQYTEGSELENISVRVGYGARLSAPGYLDCTEWCVFDTEKEAEDYLEEMYGDDEDETGEENGN